jgi:hypothetical protein
MTSLQTRPLSSEGAPSHKSVHRILIRWWWIILVGAVAGGAIGYVSARGEPPAYEADALVVASTSSIQSTDFGPLAEAAFGTNAVLQPVIDRLGLRTTPQSLLGSGQLRAKSVSNTVALRVTGRSRDPQLASDLAAVAAESFASAATDKQMGTFAVFGPGGVPGTLQPPLTRQNTVLGAAAGGAIASLLLLLFIVARRPVLTTEEAVREFAADAAFTARVRIPMSAMVPWRIDRPEQIHPRGLIPMIWQLADSNSSGGGSRICCVLVGKRRRTSRALLALLQDLKTGSPVNPQHEAQLIWTDLPSASLPATLKGATAVVALVAAGAPRRSLQTLDEELRTVMGDMTRILVLVNRGIRQVAHAATSR